MSNAAPTLIGALQRTLETIYDVRSPVQVDDYLVCDEAVAQRLDPAGRTNAEKLLIRSDNEQVELALVIARDSLLRLERDNPLRALSDSNFRDFCLVLEGVSHFTYAACNAALNKRITLLELELQAEVDKYVVASLLLRRQHSVPQHRALWRRLFDRVGYADTLSRVELERYARANRAARRFCRRLQRPHDVAMPRMATLRRFYRMPKLAKLAAC
ncbi:MAG: hypothetical protein AB8G16_04230 [Gammaproteobacteria bacterium]